MVAPLSPRSLCALAALAVLATTTTHAYAAAVMTTVQVPMGDGVSLATDVWRNSGDTAAHPVILRRTPYGRAVDSGFAGDVVGAGYVLVSQDVRGRGGSGGTFLPFFDDAVDGPATMAWIAKQSWSNGQVGTYGASAEGIVQFMAMKAAPAQLRCVNVAVPTDDVYTGIYPGGAWRTDLTTNWLAGLGAAGVIATWKSHEVHDGYWDAATLSTGEMASVDYPVFVTGGMFDVFSPDEIREFAYLRGHVAASSRGDVFLILGPWTHTGAAGTVQGQLAFPADAAYLDYATDFVAYFGWCLGGGPRPTYPAVRYYLTEVSDSIAAPDAGSLDAAPPGASADGGIPPLLAATGEWRTGDVWPPPESQPVVFYLQGDDTLSGAAPSAGAASIALPLDPADPAPSVGGGNLTTPPGPFDQAAVDRRPDVRALATAPVTSEVEVIGSPRAFVWASSATTDVDVVVRAEVLTPAGRAIAVTDGVKRGRFVQGFDAVRPLVPGQPTLFEVDLGPMAVRLPAGFALRFAFSGASAPRYEPNPNVAEPLASLPATVATTLTLYRDEAHPSRIEIPVAAGTLPGTVDGGVQPGDGGLASDATIDVDAPAEGDASGTAGAGTRGAAGCGCRTAPSSARSGSIVAALALLAFGTRRRRLSRLR